MRVRTHILHSLVTQKKKEEQKEVLALGWVLCLKLLRWFYMLQITHMLKYFILSVFVCWFFLVIYLIFFIIYYLL